MKDQGDGDATMAEYFTLRLPLEADRSWLALLVFLGGFSGSTAMVMVAAVALATLILNHLVMPVILRCDFRSRDISGLLLGAKRLAILAVILFGYLFHKLLGQSYALVAIGLVCFVGATQVAPVMLGGLSGNRADHRGGLPIRGPQRGIELVGRISPRRNVVTIPVIGQIAAGQRLQPGAVPRLAHRREFACTRARQPGAARKRAMRRRHPRFGSDGVRLVRCRPDIDQHGITLIEDCAQAYLAPVGDTVTGRIGHIGCFSLQQTKHISAGDGGLVVTDDAALARRMRLFADKGWPRATNERNYLFLALNYRMTELVGAVTRAQLSRLAGVVAKGLGETNVVKLDPVMGGEDFGRFSLDGQQIPVTLFWLGAVDPAKVEAFQKAQEIDPTCAMCAWGEAFVLGPNINAPMDPDANAAALGEKIFGQGKGVSDFIYMTVSTGVGGGIVVGGKLLVGSSFVAGEVGHMKVIADGEPCKCGMKGCLEAYASGTSIAR